MSVLCWSSVVDGGPTLIQHWLNAHCPRKHDMLNQYWIIFVQRCRWWANIRPALAHAEHMGPHYSFVIARLVRLWLENQ